MTFDITPLTRVDNPLFSVISFSNLTDDLLTALLYSINKGFYRAYHQMGLAFEGQMSPLEMRWMRLVLALVALVIVVFFLPQAKLVSPLVKGSLILGIFLLSADGELNQAVKDSQSYLHSATWPLWWFIGAGIIMLIRRSALVLFNWIHAILPFWLVWGWVLRKIRSEQTVRSCIATACHMV